MTSAAGYAEQKHREIACPKCKAKSGKPCVSKNGKLAPYSHAARWKKANKRCHKPTNAVGTAETSNQNRTSAARALGRSRKTRT